MLRVLMASTVVGAALLLSGCETPGGKVSVLASDSVALTPGATYAWAPHPAGSSTDPRLANDIIDQRIHNAIDQALAAKGYRRVASPASAQLQVAYYAALQDRQETEVDSWGGNAGTMCGIRGCISGWGLYGAPQVDVRNIDYTQGTLMIDITDRTSGRLAWRATSDKRVDASDASQASINAIVMDMTKALPGSTPAP